MDVRTHAAEIHRAMNHEIVFARLCTGFAILALARRELSLQPSPPTRIMGVAESCQTPSSHKFEEYLQLG
jgi:hypothetical protein